MFSWYLEFYQNFHAANKTYLLNVCFASPSSTVFWGLGFIFAFKFTSYMIVLHSFGKRFDAIFFCFYAMFYRLDPLARIGNLFAGSMVFRQIRKYHSWAQAIIQFWLWKYQSQIFADFNILQILILELYF